MPKLNIRPNWILDKLEQDIEMAVQSGYYRAHKHTETPSEEQVKTAIHEAVMNTLHEAIEFVTYPETSGVQYSELLRNLREEVTP